MFPTTRSLPAWPTPVFLSERGSHVAGWPSTNHAALLRRCEQTGAVRAHQMLIAHRVFVSGMVRCGGHGRGSRQSELANANAAPGCNTGSGLRGLRSLRYGIVVRSFWRRACGCGLFGFFECGFAFFDIVKSLLNGKASSPINNKKRGKAHSMTETCSSRARTRSPRRGARSTCLAWSPGT